MQLVWCSNTHTLIHTHKHTLVRVGGYFTIPGVGATVEITATVYFSLGNLLINETQS